MKNLVPLIITAILIVQTQPAFSMSESQFVRNAVTSSLFEIESGRLALEKSKNNDVRAFAQNMIDDHTEAVEELKAAAKKDGIESVPNELDGKQQSIVERLRAASASEFDRQYGQAQFRSHENAVDLFKSFAKGAKGGALADYAVRWIPVLQEHYAAAGKLPD